jgi:probable rRNA maturation factor
MTIEVEVQNASSTENIPDSELFTRWVSVVLGEKANVDVVIRVVDDHEMQGINALFRGQDRPTNVLSFGSDLPEAIRGQLGREQLGDIVICAPLVLAEAAEQGKKTEAHWAHLTIHGLLHLLGHDHQADAEAEEMEALEIRHLAELGHPNPYQ